MFVRRYIPVGRAEAVVVAVAMCRDTGEAAEDESRPEPLILLLLT